MTRDQTKNGESMAAQWWSMSLHEKSIAIRDDADYLDENGSLKDFRKEVWKAGCKWQRRMCARDVRTIAKLGERMEVSQTDGTQLYGENDNQGIATVDDEDAFEGTDSNIVDVLSQQIQAKYEGICRKNLMRRMIYTNRRRNGCLRCTNKTWSVKDKLLVSS